MPFGYLEFSRAKRRELCSHMRARGAGTGAGPGAGAGSGLGSLPGPANSWAVAIRNEPCNDSD